LTNDENKYVRISVVEIIGKYWDEIPNASELLERFLYDTYDVKKYVAEVVAWHFDEIPNVSKFVQIIGKEEIIKASKRVHSLYLFNNMKKFENFIILYK